MNHDLISNRLSYVQDEAFKIRKNGTKAKQCRYRCSCGNEIITFPCKVRSNHTKSCGCLQKDMLNARNKRMIKHGMARTPEHKIYIAARNRCQNPMNRSYRVYGARGIEFRFQSFNDFFRSLGKRPSIRHSVDRIDNYGHYEEGNVRWASQKEQNNNRRGRKEMHLWSFILLVRSDIFRRSLNHMSPRS